MRIDFTIPPEKQAYLESLFSACYPKRDFAESYGRSKMIGRMLYDGLLEEHLRVKYSTGSDKTNTISNLWLNNAGLSSVNEQLKQQIEKYKTHFGELPEDSEITENNAGMWRNFFGIGRFFSEIQKNRFGLVLGTFVFSALVIGVLVILMNKGNSEVVVSELQASDTLKTEIPNSGISNLENRIKREINRNSAIINQFK